MVEFASGAIASANGNFALGPSAGLIAFTLLACIGVLCGMVTAAKDRWGWFALGLLTSGLLWIVGAAQPARSGSLWLRLAARRSRTAR